MNSVKFSFICHADHDGAYTNRDGPTITLVAKQWAYCARGATQDHDWAALELALALEDLQAKAIARKAVL